MTGTLAGTGVTLVLVALNAWALVETWLSARTWLTRVAWSALVLALPLLGFSIWVLAGPRGIRRAAAPATPRASIPESRPGR